MPQPWSDTAEQHLLDTSTCPRCGSAAISGQRCQSCGADLSGPEAAELWRASVAAAEALRARQAILDRVPTRQATPVGRAAAGRAGQLPPPVGAPTATDAPASAAAPPVSAAPPASLAPPVPAATAASSQITVQSVLAIAGAGLFAVAAIVFTFLNPDLTDVTTRTSIIAVTTVLFLGGAWLLARRKLQFSAEAVGALGMVFLALDVWALSQHSPAGVSGWWFAALGLLVSAGVMFAVSLVAGIRTWLWISLVGLAILPAFVGYAVSNEWAREIGHLGVGFAAVGMAELARRVSARMGSPLLADRSALTVLRALVVIVVLSQIFALPAPSPELHALGAAGLLAGLAVLAALSARQQLAPVWSLAAGVFFTTAAAILPLAVHLTEVSWDLALVPAAAGIGALLLGLLPVIRSLPRGFLLTGAAIVTLVMTVPAFVTAVVQVFGPVVSLLQHGTARGLTLAQTFTADPKSAIIGAIPGIATFLGIAATALALWALSHLARRATPPSAAWANGMRLTAMWIGVAAVLVLTGWTAVPRPVQVAIALVITLLLVVLLRQVAAVANAPTGLRAPLIAAVHALPVLAVAISWSDSNVTIVGGAAIVAVLAAVARVVPASWRAVYLGVGYAYALIVFATALDLAHVETIALLCLTTTLAALAALAATLTRWLSVRSWYAVLIVTSVPFLVGVISVLIVRSGWTALSTGVIFVLALALMLTRRTGTTRVLRAGAASLLVPALAVVIISLGAQLLAVSASPITLPVVAVIVACVLPSTGLIRSLLVGRGIPEVDAQTARIAIEASSLVTAALAVVLALVRTAAGLNTSFLVLVILGVGAIATAIWGRRSYAWWVAGASFTGALWCVWAIQGIDIVEPYLLPPALAAAIIGAILVLRGRARGVGLYATGLIVAAVPTVVILAITGSGDHPLAPWRAYGLLAASFLLLVLGTLQTRWPKRFVVRAGALAVPTLVVAVVTASAGAIQAIRFGWQLDPLVLSDSATRMIPVLAFGVAAAGLAALGAAQLHEAPIRLAGARAAAAPPPAAASKKRGTKPADAVADAVADVGLVVTRSRWLYTPALVLLVVGPWSAIDDTPLAIWTDWALMLALLVLLVVTAAHARLAATTLPPVWFTWVLAFITAIVSWSQREILRVEAYSLPLGLFLLAAGVVGMLSAREGREVPRATLNSWPIGRTGSWRLLAPGVIVCFLASVVATGTDPQTWRAILVIGMALAAILIGSVRKLAAPFVIGIIVLVVENIVVFASQIGHHIESVPWWITLAVAGALLLIIAVTYERRDGQDGSIAARMRDLQ